MTADTELEDLFKQANSAFRKEKYAEALQVCTRIVQVDLNHTEAWYLRAKAKYALGNTVGALQDLTAVLEIDPTHMLARFKRTEYAYVICLIDLDTVLEQFPAYCQQLGLSVKDVPYKLPSETRHFTYDLMQLCEDFAYRAEREYRWQDAIHYWQAYHDSGGTFDGSREDVLRRIEKLKQKLNAENSDNTP